MGGKFFNLSGYDVGRTALFVVMIFHALSHGVVDARTPLKKDNDQEKRQNRAHKFTVKTIETADGDTIDCVDIYRQPAFDHPSLRNHTIQMQPSTYPTGFKSASSRHPKLLLQRFKSCPEGTVPILRTKPLGAAGTNAVARKGRRLYQVNTPDDSINEERVHHGHEHAIVYLDDGKFYGAQADLNVWNPVLEDAKHEMSLGQIWLLSGQMRTSDLNSVEAGWTVLPSTFGDNQTRLFTFWTNDSYNTGCYNLLCPGFVQTSTEVSLGGALGPVSTYEGDQYIMSLIIFKDPQSGNWWLTFQDRSVGYWPSSLFKGLADSATVIEWGGEIFNDNPNGMHTATQMGSGHFSGEGFKKASFFSNLQYVDGSDVLQHPHALNPFLKAPKCYNIDIGKNKGTNMGSYFYYGGPGRSPDCP
ncbi:protein neprosin-like [Aristolochia californica]|uniref:protein neprosin-like n=1 Tax=Aristolochia californica TaxID=171875 RepID=UPI0035DB7CBC